jgi:hypothetical protein
MCGAASKHYYHTVRGPFSVSASPQIVFQINLFLRRATANFNLTILTTTMAQPLTGNLFAPSHVGAASPLFPKIPCRSPACNRWFCNNAGLTQHMRAKHPFTQPQERPNPPPWPLEEVVPPPEDFDIPMDVDADDQGEGSVIMPEWEHHPLLCGKVSSLPVWLTRRSLALFPSNTM